MDLNALAEIISSLGFPVVCVLGLGWFLHKVWINSREDMVKQMELMGERCQAREDKLYEQIDKFSDTLNNFNATLTRIDLRLEEVEKKME